MLNKNHIKNLIGKRTNRKLVAFSVDDYGTQRTASLEARENLIRAKGSDLNNRFDMFDSLESAEDLEMLFEVLTSVKDKNGKGAVFTPFALSANPNFEAMIADGFSKYIYETLPETYQKVHGNLGAMELVKQGIASGIFVPQYHGREHLNLKVMMALLAAKDPIAIACFENQSWSAITSPFPNISFTAAFEFEDIAENKTLGEIALDGTRLFEQVYGYKALHFAAPGDRESYELSPYLLQGGIKYVDRTFIERQHLGGGKQSIPRIHYTGQKNGLGQQYIVRNCVFEPTNNRSIDSVAHCMSLVDAAFAMNRTANISSHRVNYSGTIDPENRAYGLQELKRLLDAIVRKYPDVEFIKTTQIITEK